MPAQQDKVSEHKAGDKVDNPAGPLAGIADKAARKLG